MLNLFPGDHSMYLNHSNGVPIAMMDHLFGDDLFSGSQTGLHNLKKSRWFLCAIIDGTWSYWMRVNTYVPRFKTCTYMISHSVSNICENGIRIIRIDSIHLFSLGSLFIPGLGSRFSCHRLAIARDWIISSGKQIITSGYSDNSVTGPASGRNFDHLDSGRYITASNVKAISHRQRRRYYMQDKFYPCR